MKCKIYFIIAVIIILMTFSSCGKKGDPVYNFYKNLNKNYQVK